MKKITYLIILLFGLTLTLTFLSTNHVMAQDYHTDTISYYHFDEGSGSTAEDSVGNNNGTLSGDTDWVDGKCGKGLRFNGYDDYVLIPNSSELEFSTAESFSISCWFQIDNDDTLDYKTTVLYGSIVGPAQYEHLYTYGYYDWTLSDNPGVSLRGEGDEQTGWFLHYESDLRDGEWHFFTLTHTADNVKLYIDGIEVESNTNAGSGTYNLGAAWRIAGLEGVTDSFTGIIDEFAFYSDSLSLSEIQQLYQDGINCEVEIPQLSCTGFGPPLDKPISVKKKNRVLPLKMVCYDEDGMEITYLEFPPVVEVDFEGNNYIPDVVEEALPTGQGDEGNQFVYAGDHWQFNLQTNNFSGPGLYLLRAVSGDPDTYVINPFPEATFEMK